MKCFCVMAFAARCVAKWCKGETHRLITSFHGKMVVVTCRTIFKFCALPVTPRNFGMNTTPENKKNFQTGWLQGLLENKFSKKCTKKFSSKTVSGSPQDKSQKKCMPFCHATFGGFGHFVMPLLGGYEWGVCSPKSRVCIHPLCRVSPF